MLSLYLHFPFCKRKCSYCDFCSSTATVSEIAAYCRALVTEINLTAGRYRQMPVETVFLGGGTPSAVPASLMGEVLDALTAQFTLAPGAEFSSEANPGTLTDEWLATLVQAGGNRLSIGVQAMQPELLKGIERIHTFSEALDAIAMAHRHGLTNVNADVMFGLPNQTAAQYFDTLQAVAQAGVTHISAYSLILEEGTPLFSQVLSGDITVPNEDAVADMLEGGIRHLAEMGFARYEISNFAKAGFACRHNLNCWQLKPYLGLGLNAASLLPAPPDAPGIAYVRQSNTVDMATYLDALSQGRLPVAETLPIGKAEAMFETVMLGLRTVAGVRYADFERMYSQKLDEVYATAIATLNRQGLLKPQTADAPYLALTQRGMALQNTALMPFMQTYEK